jgi:hypothetical protein
MKQIAQNLPGASAVFTRKLEKLQTSTSFISNPDLKLLLAFDEAPALIEMETSHVQKTILLSRALSSIIPDTVFAWILCNLTDTTSRIAKSCPTLYKDSSST